MMEVLHGLEGLRKVPSGRVLSVGNFDGIHRGQNRMLRLAASLKQAGQASGIAVVSGLLLVASSGRRLED